MSFNASVVLNQAATSSQGGVLAGSTSTHFGLLKVILLSETTVSFL